MRTKKIVLLILSMVSLGILGLWMNRDSFLRSATFEEFRFPTFAVERLDGTSTTIVPSHHAATVVMFWATWCEACKEDLQLLRDLAVRPDLSEVGFYALSKDENREDVVALLEKMGLAGEFEVLLDVGEKVSPLFEVYAVPETFLVSREGMVVKRFVGSIVGEKIDFRYQLERLRRAGMVRR